MSNKLFIAYSHIDEAYINDFRKYINPLKQNGLISDWYDRKIIGGEIFQEEINKNIETADIICLFISANFLASDSCMQEREKAFVLRKTHGVSVVPIILSECAWTDIKDISTTLALPTDGKPISTFNDPNIGWKNVYNELKKIIEKKNKEKSATITTDFQKFLNDAEMLRTAHSQKTEVHVSDIFVFPSLSKIDYDNEKENIVSSDEIFLEEFIKLEKILIAGDGQSGKTTLCKTLYSKLRVRNFFPVYIFDKMQKFDGFISNRIENSFNEQYENIKFSDIDISKLVIIIDGFHYASRNNKYKILRDIGKYIYQILIVDDIFAININDENITKNYHRYKIDQFGPILRDKLIKNWILLTDDKSSTNYRDNDFYNKVDNATELVNIGLGKLIDQGIMPSYPIFILSILSTHETFEKPLDQEITSQGYCYQALIYVCLRKQGVKNDEIDIYINFLSVLAYHFFSHSISELSEDDFQEFFSTYNEKYFISIKINTILINLQAQGMLMKTSLGNFRFLYPYLYYFFVGKYLSDHLVERKNDIKQIIENLHKDENAYIAIFLCHHTKNNFLLDEIILNAMMQFEDYKETALSKSELLFFDNELDNVAKAVLPKYISPEVERKKQLEFQENQEKENIEAKNISDKTDNKEDIYANTLRRSIRTVEVMGIITKNRIGSLERQRLEEILTEAINVNLRILSSFFDLIKDNNEQREIIKYISGKLEEMKNENNSTIPREKLEKEAKKIFWDLNFGVILNLILKTIKSIGSDKLKNIIGDVCDKQKTSVHLLIKHGVFMWYGKNLNTEKILKDIKTIDFSLTAKEVLRYLIVYHCMLHNIDANEKNRIQSKFEISSKALLKIEAKK
jgi:hypothetical protein